MSDSAFRSSAAPLLVLATALLFGALPARAGDPIDTEILVNAPATAGNQEAPDIAVGTDGTFVIVWRDDDGSGNPPKGQRFNSFGVAVGAQLEVQDSTSGGESAPRVAAQRDGDFVVVWRKDPALLSRRFDSSGADLTAEIPFGIDDGGIDEFDARVASDAAGEFVVLWRTVDAEPGHLFARRRNEAGTSDVTGLFEVADGVAMVPKDAEVASDAFGNTVAVWGDLGATFQVWGARHSSDGTPLGAPFQVPTTTGSDDFDPSVVRRPSGEFVVAWEASSVARGSGGEISARVFASDGSPVGGDVQVNVYTTGSQITPRVAMAGNGDFAVVWEDDTVGSIWARLFTSEGTPLGVDLQVSNDFTSDQDAGPASAFDPRGRLLVTWETTSSGQRDVFARRLTLGCYEEERGAASTVCCRGDGSTGDDDEDQVCNDRDACNGFDDNVDSDFDATADGCDLCPGFDDRIDTDADEVADGCDVCPGGDDTEDTDADTVPDACDVCPGGDDAEDSDKDSTPDACDLCEGFDDEADTDDDGVPDGCDVCPAGDDALDEDSDGVPDACDVCAGWDDNDDEDGDTVPDGCDEDTIFLDGFETGDTTRW